MSAKKADHLPDLTLSFEPLQSTDISRSHQPALTQNGCHYQDKHLIEKEVDSPHLDTPPSGVEVQQLSGSACLPVLQWHQDKATSMSAEKADHLPDLTLSFEPLQSKDISRSHQPALTGNGCHGHQMNTF